MDKPDFLKLKCVNSDTQTCNECGRDFLLPVSAIEGAYKSQDGNVEIFINTAHYVFDPRCLSAGGPRGNRLIKVALAWDNFIQQLNGEILDCGNITMVYIT